MDQIKSTKPNLRYWIFKGDIYYPRPGMQDFFASTISFDFIRGIISTMDSLEWIQIYDSKEYCFIDPKNIDQNLEILGD